MCATTTLSTTQTLDNYLLIKNIKENLKKRTVKLNVIPIRHRTAMKSEINTLNFYNTSIPAALNRQYTNRSLSFERIPRSSHFLVSPPG